MNKISEVICQLEEIGFECDKIAALAFVVWDSFENGGFKPEIDSYSPALKLMCEQSAELQRDFRAVLEHLYNATKEGASA